MELHLKFLYCAGRICLLQLTFHQCLRFRCLQHLRLRLGISLPQYWWVLMKESIFGLFNQRLTFVLYVGQFHYYLGFIDSENIGVQNRDPVILQFQLNNTRNC